MSAKINVYYIDRVFHKRRCQESVYVLIKFPKCSIYFVIDNNFNYLQNAEEILDTLTINREENAILKVKSR